MLRRPISADADALHDEYMTDGEATRYLSWRTHRDLDDTVAFLCYCDGEWRESRSFPFVILEGADDRPFGMIHLRRERHAVSFGYVRGRTHWGRGFASEALRFLVEWSLSQPRIHRAWAHCDVENAASARVMEKAGLSREGVFRRYAIHPNRSAEPPDAIVCARVN